MLRSQIRTAIRQRTGLATNDTAVSDTVLDAIIEAANRKVALMHDWPWLIATDLTWTATVAGTSGYAPVTNWRKTLYIVVDGDSQLIYKQPQDLRRYQNTTAQGFPQFYTVENGTIELGPIPDAVYTVDHVLVKQVAAMTDDNDTPEIGPAATNQWAIELLIEMAAVLTAERLRDRELHALMSQSFATTLSAARDDIRKSRQHPTPRHRRDIGW